MTSRQCVATLVGSLSLLSVAAAVASGPRGTGDPEGRQPPELPESIEGAHGIEAREVTVTGTIEVLGSTPLELALRTCEERYWIEPTDLSEVLAQYPGATFRISGIAYRDVERSQSVLLVEHFWREPMREDRIHLALPRTQPMAERDQSTRTSS